MSKLGGGITTAGGSKLGGLGFLIAVKTPISAAIPAIAKVVVQPPKRSTGLLASRR